MFGRLVRFGQVGVPRTVRNPLQVFALTVRLSCATMAQGIRAYHVRVAPPESSSRLESGLGSFWSLRFFLMDLRLVPPLIPSSISSGISTSFASFCISSSSRFFCFMMLSYLYGVCTLCRWQYIRTANPSVPSFIQKSRVTSARGACHAPSPIRNKHSDR